MMVSQVKGAFTSLWFMFILRVVLGSIFIAASIGKLSHQDEFVSVVTSYGLLPDSLARLYASVLPWAELIIGCLLVIGLFSRFASAMSIPLITSFLVANTYGLFHSVEGTCGGCFGQLLPMSQSIALVIDAVMLLIALRLLFHKPEFLNIGYTLHRTLARFGRSRRLGFANAGKSVTICIAVLIIMLTLLFPAAPTMAQETVHKGASSGSNEATPVIIDPETSIASYIRNALDSGKPAFLYFYAEWCHYCQKQKPIFDELEREYTDKANFIRVNIENNPDVMEEFGVTAFPTMFLISDRDEKGEYVYERFKGFTDEEILKGSLDYLLWDTEERVVLSEVTAVDSTVIGLRRSTALNIPSIDVFADKSVDIAVPASAVSQLSVILGAATNNRISQVDTDYTLMFDLGEELIAGDDITISEFTAQSTYADIQIIDHSTVGLAPVVGETFAGQSVTVKNLGPDPATNVTITLTLPPNVSMATSQSSGLTCTGTTCTIGALGVNAYELVLVRMHADAPGSGTVTYSVSADQDDPNLTNNSVSRSVQVLTTALGITGSAPSSALIDTPFDLTYIVSNLGPASAENVTFEQDLYGSDPDYNVVLLTYVSSSSSQGSCAATQVPKPKPGGGTYQVTRVTCTIGTLASVGDEATVTVSVQLGRPTTVKNIKAEVSATDARGATSFLSVDVGFVDLTLTQALSTSSVTVGDTFSNTISGTNNGPDVAKGVGLITSFSPSLLQFVSATPSQGSCYEGSNYISCELGDIPNGATYSVTVTYTALSPATSTAFMSSAWPDNPDTAEYNNSHTLWFSIGVNSPPIANIGGPYTVIEGETVILNGSGNDPDGDPLTYTWDLDNDGIFETVGQNPLFSAVGRTGPDSQIVVLQVCDPEGLCDTDSTSIAILARPDLIIESFTHSPMSPTSEDMITFTAVVKNVGGSEAAPSTLNFRIGGETFGEDFAIGQGKIGQC